MSSILLCFILGIYTICSSSSANISPPRALTVVPTQWLHGYIQKHPYPTREVRVLETSFNRNAADSYPSAYISGHIPQAAYFDLNKCVSSTPLISRNVPEPNCFTKYIQKLGVWPNTHVIVYTRSGAYHAFRAWWLFRLYGHKNISVLNGGFSKWTADGFETSSNIPLIQSSNITVALDGSLIRTYDDMLTNVRTQAEQVIDARSPYSQWTIGRAFAMIPNARIVTYSKLLNNDGTLKPYANIKTLFEEGGVNISLPMVTYCNSGMTATVVAGAAHALGKDIPVYYGSWNEWSKRAPENLKQLVFSHS